MHGPCPRLQLGLGRPRLPHPLLRRRRHALFRPRPLQPQWSSGGAVHVRHGLCRRDVRRGVPDEQRGPGGLFTGFVMCLACCVFWAVSHAFRVCVRLCMFVLNMRKHRLQHCIVCLCQWVWFSLQRRTSHSTIASD